MQLDIEYSGEIGQGNYPDFLQFYDTVGQQFYVKNGQIYGKSSNKIDNGEFDTTVWQDENNVSPPNDIDISRLELKTLTGFGIVGSYLNSDNKQVMIIYEFQQDMSKYLNSGSIRFGIDTPIASFNLSLENPIDEETEIDGPVAINEKTSLLSPGAKVIFSFTAGDDLEEVELGSYYIDRSSYDVLSETANAEGRNLIGKALKDQTLNQSNNPDFNQVSEILRDLLLLAKIDYDKFFIENTTEKRTYEFNPNDEILSTIQLVLQSMIDWKIEEKLDGTIVIGSPNYGEFMRRTTYFFRRDTDIFTRNITTDDQQVYRKVCVHNADFSMSFYKDVENYTGWNLKNNKTLFVQIADGISFTDTKSIAANLAEQLEMSGKVESFTGPFRPQLIIGNNASILDGNIIELGLITEVTHVFGKQGFYTNFTVDSGGRLGKGRLSDYIEKIGNLISRTSSGTIAYPADLTAYQNALSAVNQIDYTPESWVIYQAVVVANVVFESNTQAQVDLATNKIIAAQSNLVLKV